MAENECESSPLEREQIPSTSVDQQCEKADLESREKESSLCSLNEPEIELIEIETTRPTEIEPIIELPRNGLTLDLNNKKTDDITITENNNNNNTAISSLLNTPTTLTEGNRKCEYLKGCVKFMKNLILPGKLSSF